MGWNPLKKIAQGAKKLVTNPVKAVENIGRSVGGAVQKAAPVLNMIPGVGPVAAAGLGALGSVAAGGNMRDHARTALSAGGSALGGSILSGAGKMAGGIPGVSGVMGAAKSLGGVQVPGMGTVGSIVKGQLPNMTGGWGGGPGAGGVLGAPSGGSAAAGRAAGPAPASGGSRYGAVGDFARNVLSGGKPLTLENMKGAGGIPGAVGGAIDYAKDNPDMILAGGSIISGAMDAAKASDLRDKALRSAEGSYNERAPMRAMGMAGLGNTQRPNLSATFADPGNPYARPAGSTPGTSPVQNRPSGPAMPPTARPKWGKAVARASSPLPSIAAAEVASGPRAPVLRRRGSIQAMLDDPRARRGPLRRAI